MIARTRDDAAGEAFDKVAKILGLGYPGGPAIEKLAHNGDPNSVKFPVAKISDGKPDFSFSGLKTAVVRYAAETGLRSLRKGDEPTQAHMDIAASFQAAVVRSLTNKIDKIALELGSRTFIVAGGVACNEALRTECVSVANKLGIPVYFPDKHLSTDNAAMIAAAGYFHLARGERSDVNMTADVTMRLQNLENVDAELRQRRVRYRL